MKFIPEARYLTESLFVELYIISLDEKLIKLYDKEEHCTEQYHILKLTSKEMKWENASPKDGNSDKRLEKYND